MKTEVKAYTNEEIQKRLADSIDTLGDESIIEGSFKRDIINATSLEFANISLEMVLVKEAKYIETAWGEYLTLACKDYGVDRKEAKKAKGKVLVKGNSNAYIPARSLFQTIDGLKFYTIDESYLEEDGSATIEVEASETGKEYNIAQHTLVKIPMNISGVSSVINNEHFEGGYDEETDEALRERFKRKVRLPATSGNVYHYQQWAESVEGVGGVKIQALDEGAGTVGVYIVDANGEEASPELMAKVKDYIDSVRPIGAKVLVKTPKVQPITVTITKSKGVDVERFKKLVREFFGREGFVLETVTKAMISKRFFEAGGIDYEEILLNGASKNITLGGKLPKLEEVIIHD